MRQLKRRLVRTFRNWRAKRSTGVCCQNPWNLTPPQTIPNRVDMSVRVCRVCGCRHFEVSAGAGRIMATGRGL